MNEYHDHPYIRVKLSTQRLVVLGLTGLLLGRLYTMGDVSMVTGGVVLLVLTTLLLNTELSLWEEKDD